MNFSEYKAYYSNKIRQLAQSYLRENVKLSTNECCALSIDDNELSIIGVRYHADLNDVTFHEKIKFDDFPSLRLVLTGLVDKYKLQTIPLYWLLNPELYDLNVIDSLPVPKDELRTALSWRVRSLVKYPIEESLLEYFELPAKKNTANSTPLIVAVTAQKSKLVEYINLIKDCGLHLQRIDIPELAMLNLTSLQENDEKSTAFVYFYKKSVILNISCQKVLYFTRHINIALKDNVIDYEKLSLEILRYFDFFRSQWRLSSPARLFAAAEAGDTPIIAKALSERLLNTVVPYSLNGTLVKIDKAATINIQYLLDYGCLLRKEGVDVTSRH